MSAHVGTRKVAHFVTCDARLLCDCDHVVEIADHKVYMSAKQYNGQSLSMFFLRTLFIAALLMTGSHATADARKVMSFDPANARSVSNIFSPSTFTNRQMTLNQNTMDVVRDPAMGHNVVRFSAAPRSGGTVSKSSVLHQGFTAPEGSTLVVELDVFVEGSSAKGLFLADIECRSCWPERSLISNKSPGIRLFVHNNGRLGLDRGKLGMRGSALLGQGPAFPTNQWAKIRWRMQVSSSDQAYTEILVNGVPHLQTRGATLMNDRIFRRNGIRLQRFLYDYVEFGITANESGGNRALRLGDVKISLE